MVGEASVESKVFAQTLEDLMDEAEMADGVLAREKVDKLYLRRLISPDEAIRIEKALHAQGFSVLENEPQVETETKSRADAPASYATATDQLIADARRVPLLTPDEEAAHGEAIQRGLKLQEKPSELRTDVDERLIAAGKRSHDALVHHNIRLVTSFVFNPKYRHRHDIDDMVQMGLLGLMKAAERYDPFLGFRFSTYAMWWIRQSIHRGIANDGKTIRVPVHMLEHISKFKRTKRTLNLTEGTTSNAVKRIAESLGWTDEYTARVAQIAEMRTVSMETPVGSERELTLTEFIRDRLPGPEALLITSDTATQIREIVDDITDERHRDIIKRRFGIDGPSETLEAIGQRYGVTRERIRQIEAKILKKLKHRLVYGRLKYLKD